MLNLSNKLLNIGVSGHQQLGDERNINWVKTRLRLLIKELNINVAYSSLAIGADQLFARICVETGITLRAIIPCLSYEMTFSSEDKSSYSNLLLECQSVETLGYDYPSEQAFYSAGKYLVDRCDLMFLIWNQKPAAGLGGTADIFTYSQMNRKQIVLINPENRHCEIM